MGLLERGPSRAGDADSVTPDRDRDPDPEDPDPPDEARRRGGCCGLRRSCGARAGGVPALGCLPGGPARSEGIGAAPSSGAGDGRFHADLPAGASLAKVSRGSGSALSRAPGGPGARSLAGPRGLRFAPVSGSRPRGLEVSASARSRGACSLPGLRDAARDAAGAGSSAGSWRRVAGRLSALRGADADRLTWSK